jgi:hypothetical protein
MANTFQLIQSATVGAGGSSSINFTAIDSTYTDLYLFLSLRYSGSDTSSVNVKLNNTTSNYSGRAFRGNGGATNCIYFTINNENIGGNSTGSSGSSQTANTWATARLYIGNYTAATAKDVQVDFAQEANNTNAFLGAYGVLWNDTTAISSIYITPDTSTTWVQYSSAYLYGIKKS